MEDWPRSPAGLVPWHDSGRQVACSINDSSISCLINLILENLCSRLCWLRVAVGSLLLGNAIVPVVTCLPYLIYLRPDRISAKAFPPNVLH
jgi:hypothetical protein